MAIKGENKKVGNKTWRDHKIVSYSTNDNSKKKRIQTKCTQCLYQIIKCLL